MRCALLRCANCHLAPSAISPVFSPRLDSHRDDSQNPSTLPHVGHRLPLGAGLSLKHASGRGLRHRRDVWAVGGSTKPWSPYSSGTYILRGAGRRFVSLDPLLDCQHGQVEILGDPRVQGVDAASWAHKVSDGASNSPCVACADHPPHTPAGW